MTTWLLPHGTDGFHLSSPAIPTLGSALVCILAGDTLTQWALARIRWESAPWCALVVASTTPGLDERVTRLLVPRACSLGAVRLGNPGQLPSVDEIRLAIRRRPTVGVEQFAAYVAMRTTPPVERLVHSSLTESTNATSYDRLRRRLRETGTYAPRDWMRLFMLCRALELSGCGEAKSQERTALQLGLAPRTLSIWTRDYLQTHWQTAISLGAWEPVTELALRVAGYTSEEKECSEAPRRRVSGPHSRL